MKSLSELMAELTWVKPLHEMSMQAKEHMFGNPDFPHVAYDANALGLLTLNTLERGMKFYEHYTHSPRWPSVSRSLRNYGAYLAQARRASGKWTSDAIAVGLDPMYIQQIELGYIGPKHLVADLKKWEKFVEAQRTLEDFLPGVELLDVDEVPEVTFAGEQPEYVLSR
ncbi:hypothetical protein HY490_00395 [Candidatus Woesearchaeota archaeon]|nr:hypothetical protein [Candidatus Woesearchaeota archaeon]